MPDSDWGPRPAPIAVLALVIAFLGVVVWDALEYPRPGSIDRRYETSEYADRAHERVLLECANLTGAEQAACAAEIVSSEREEHRSEQDLNAQRYMAFWSFWMVAASVLAALAAIVGLVLLRWTWQETKRAADVTREIGEAQVRAYMVFVGVQVVHKKDAGGFIAGITLRAVLQNTGQSPAEVFDLRTVVGNAPPNTPVLRFAFDPSQKFKTRIEVGSGQQANSNSPFIRLSDFERIVSDGDWLYLYAEAAYRDVFHYTEGRARPSHGAYFAARVQPALNMAAPRKEEAFGVPFTYCELSQFDVTGGYED